MPECPRCGRPLRSGALEGLCPACLMRQALASGTDSGSDDGSGVGDSVLFTTSLASSPWTLVTLMADDEEYVTYLARPRDGSGPGGDVTRLGQLVVRKQHVPSSERADARQQLQRRLHALRRLSHPTLTPILDGGLTEEGHPYLVTTFVMATPLVDLDPEVATPARVRELLEDARVALQTLHDAGLAHGRVRASTILARRSSAGATTVVTGYAPLAPLPSLAPAIADDLSQFQRLTSTLRV